MKRRYVAGDMVPKSVGLGRLVHNHLRHWIDQPCGVNGFRAWTDTRPPSGFKRCVGRRVTELEMQAAKLAPILQQFQQFQTQQ